MKKPFFSRHLVKTLLNVTSSSLVLLAFMILPACMAHVSGDLEGDAKLLTMKPDIMACLVEGAAGQEAKELFAKKYNVPLDKLNGKVLGAPPPSNGGWPEWLATIVCNAEIYSAIGGIPWRIRYDMEKYSVMDVLHYCIVYSQYCDHYIWEQGCLKKHCPGCR